MNYASNNLKNVLHGFFLAVALTIAEPSTTLPLIVHHFSANEAVVGLFTSLLRGGAILVQLVAAFFAQSYTQMMPYLKRVFVARFLSWLSIGVAILILGDKNPTLTLLAIGIGLFIFSFSAGFGSIYFNEILAKIFTHEERGRSMANRQFFAAIGSILSGAVAGYILQHFTPPQSFGYLFIVSAFFMAIGLFAFSTIKEPPKKQIEKSRKFADFFKNALTTLKEDRRLQVQILVVLLSYSFLFSFAFIILQAKSSIDLSGYLVGGFITIQMTGALLGNLIYKRLSPNFKLIITLSFLFAITAYTNLLFSQKAANFFIAFFLLGMAVDGFRIASMNLLLLIAPESKRPLYIALQNNLTSIGLFFAVPGGLIVHYFGYTILYTFTICMLSLGLVIAWLKLPKSGIDA